MFGTWKYDPETDEVQNLRRAYDPITARSSQHQACNRCHEKKLKCSGEKDGCERCVANQLTCEYTRSSSRGSRRGKKNRRRSAESTSTVAAGREDSPSSTRTGGSQSQSVSRGQTVQPHPFSPRQEAKSPSHVAVTCLPTTAEPQPITSYDSIDEGSTGRLLDRLDFSMLGPGDGFDINMLLGNSNSGGGGVDSAHHSSAPSSSMSPHMRSIYADPSTASHQSSPYPPHHQQHTSMPPDYRPWDTNDYVMACTSANMSASTLSTAGTGYSTPNEDILAQSDYMRYQRSIHDQHAGQSYDNPYWSHGHARGSGSTESDHGR